MESDLQRHHHLFHDHHQRNRHQKQNNNSGLTRYQSAPSTYFSSFLDDFLDKPSSPETESIFARLLASSGMNTIDNITDQNIEPVIKQESPVQEPVLPVNQIMGSMMASDQTRLRHQQQQEQQKLHKQRPNFSGTFYQSQSKPPLPDKNPSSGMDNRVASSIGRERLAQMKPIGGQNSSLVRHSSSPAGLFSNINIEMENGYAVVRGTGNFETGNRETAYSGATCPENAGLGETGGSNYASGFPVGSWDDRTVMSASSKGLTDDDRTFSGPTASENQVDQAANRPPLLAHHLSLPKTSAELSAIEKYLQDSVPCKIRAKRGCATHPRSIAERVRRTRISERMRKLQDLVPNMEKQTNTSDMLDFAVDYIKDLQRKVKLLSDNRSKCTCSSKQQQQL